jgi:sugar/nucleoside kinase (ribokinase family)
VRTPAFPVPVVDTTGAGDAFRAGLAAAWVRGGEAATLARALAVANATAALNCRAEGAQQGLPSWEEVSALVGARSERI